MYILLPDVDFSLFISFLVVNKQCIKLLLLMEAIMALELKRNEMCNFNCTDNNSKSSTSLKKQLQIITNLQQAKELHNNNVDLCWL